MQWLDSRPDQDDYDIKAVRIMVALARGRRGTRRSEQALWRAAGQHPDRLAHRHPSGWEEIVKAECSISRSRANELIQIGRGKSLTEARSKTADRVKKHRENKGRNR